MASEWIGDKTDGIEIRRATDGIDEVLLYVGGHCMMHMEKLAATQFWFLFDVKDRTALHMAIGSVNRRAAIDATCEKVGPWPRPI